MEKLNSYDHHYMRLAFLAIFSGIVVEPAMILILLQLWFNDNKTFAIAPPIYRFKKNQMPIDIFVNFACKYENITVASKQARIINNILSFLDAFKSDGDNMRDECKYLSTISATPLEVIDEQIAAKITRLIREKDELEPEFIRSTNFCIKEWKNTKLIINILKHFQLNALKSHDDLTSLIKAMFLYSVRNIRRYDKSYDKIKIQQIVSRLTHHGIMSFLDNLQKNILNDTYAERLCQISKFFDKVKQEILDNIYPVRPNLKHDRLSLLGYFVNYNQVAGDYLVRTPAELIKFWVQNKYYNVKY